ncbi:MAG: response regulator [Kofleriaceae bacterium]
MAPPSPTGCKVLLVEDDLTIAAELARRITAMGHTVTSTATSRDEMIDACEVTRPDVVLMDIGIRGPVDGIVAAYELFERYGLRVIYLTGDADVSSMERAKATRPYAYLLKPVSAAELRGAIEIARFAQTNTS